MKETNNYEIAIKEDRTIDFLLGREEYHHADDQFSRELHVPYLTFREIKEYGIKHGETKMLKHFATDIKKVLQLNLFPFEFFYITVYIYLYMRHFYEEKSLAIEWILDEETKTLIKNHYNSFLNQFDTSEKFNNRFPKESNGFFLDNIISNYKFIKERFGVDLLA